MKLTLELQPTLQWVKFKRESNEANPSTRMTEFVRRPWTCRQLHDESLVPTCTERSLSEAPALVPAVPMPNSSCWLKSQSKMRPSHPTLIVSLLGQARKTQINTSTKFLHQLRPCSNPAKRSSRKEGTKRATTSDGKTITITRPDTFRW